jgi:hypothetical protein
MQIKDAMMIWDSETKQVEVCKRGQMPKDPEGGYFYSTGACWSAWKELTNDQRIIVLFSTAIKQSNEFDIPIGNFYDALKMVNEAYDALSESGWPVGTPVDTIA